MKAPGRAYKPCQAHDSSIKNAVAAAFMGAERYCINSKEGGTSFFYHAIAFAGVALQGGPLKHRTECAPGLSDQALIDSPDFNAYPAIPDETISIVKHRLSAHPEVLL